MSLAAQPRFYEHQQAAAPASRVNRGRFDHSGVAPTMAK
jgi:hypothetical protein